MILENVTEMWTEVGRGGGWGGQAHAAGRHARAPCMQLRRTAHSHSLHMGVLGHPACICHVLRVLARVCMEPCAQRPTGAALHRARAAADSQDRQGQEGVAACEQGPVREQDVLERRLGRPGPVSARASCGARLRASRRVRPGQLLLCPCACCTRNDTRPPHCPAQAQPQVMPRTKGGAGESLDRAGLHDWMDAADMTDWFTYKRSRGSL